MMSDKYSPLSLACAGALGHKNYDKRKTAALEIEKMVKEFNALNNTNQIRRLITVLKHEFVMSPIGNTRQGGLMAFSTTAIGLGKDIEPFADDLIKPILECFSDPDVQVRYSACEALYNVMKVCRGIILKDFSNVFNAVSKIAIDTNQNVRNSTELLDRLLKDIVSECDAFDLESFAPILRERVYSKSPFARQFIINWISVLDMVPNVNLLRHLPDLLDGLFRILGDANADVKNTCETTLGQFLRAIKCHPDDVRFSQMINVLISHAANDRNDDLVQFIAITWIKEFVQLSGAAMLPYMSGILAAILPCLAYDTEIRKMIDIKETATAVNFTLTKLLDLEADGEQRKGDQAEGLQLDLKSVVNVLTQYIMHNSIQTKVAVLKWIHELYTKLPHKMVNYIDIVFPSLQQALSDESEQVAQQCLVVIAEVISTSSTIRTQPSPYFNKFLLNLLQSFKQDRDLLERRGHFIVRQLCVLLNAMHVYDALATILVSQEPDLRYASLMVDHLNVILLTAPELHSTRAQLKEEPKTDTCCAFFQSLYRAWCHNPVATVALCLLTQNYGHVFDLIQLFGDLEVTVDFLNDIDKLVQLIESPIFAYLRLDLLKDTYDKSLIRSLYGLLMLLPQSEAFQTLRNRLNCIPTFHCHQCDRIDQKEQCNTKTKRTNYSPKSGKEVIDFDHLLKYFSSVQQEHKEYRRILRNRELSLGGEGDRKESITSSSLE